MDECDLLAMDMLCLHHATPALAVADPRGILVCSVAYWRQETGQVSTTRLTRQVFDGVGRLAEQWDARLAAPALGQCSSLSGKVLASDSVDAGWRVSLFGEAEQVLAGWDGRGSQGDIEYDTSLRTVAVIEQARVVERFEYGGVDASAANQCGRVMRHDDPAGTRHMTEYDLLGLSQCEVSHFLQGLGSPDWPLDIAERDRLLESEPGLASRWAYSPLGDLLSLTDAHGHRRYFSYSVAGQLSQGWLQPANSPAPGQCLVQDIRYNPAGKVERETAGNGVVTVAEYALSDGRLERLSTWMPNAEPLQDLRYTVDPVGSVVQIDDHALPIRYFKNQRIDPQRVYTYDTLGQLISATGWETASPGAVLNYSEEYAYDAGSNMTELRHVGAQSFTRLWIVAPDSNRSLIDDDQPVDFPSHFDANGNLKFLQRGQVMTWDLRNQLASVSPVVRQEEDDDTERYIYGGGGKRLRKVRTTLTNATTVIAEVRYLPGLELHRRPTGERYQVLDLEAGRNRITWFFGPDAPDHPLRYQLTDHLGSGTLELDEQGNVQSREDYYPFGGTASEDHRGQTGAYKTIRYSGKERDATGLYYYGFRYYAPWLNRWINPDPAGAVDGLNFYCFVRNSPMTRWDPDGRDSDREEDGNENSNSDWDLPDELLHLPGPDNAPPDDTRAAELNTPGPSPRADSNTQSSVGGRVQAVASSSMANPTVLADSSMMPTTSTGRRAGDGRRTKARTRTNVRRNPGLGARALPSVSDSVLVPLVLSVQGDLPLLDVSASDFDVQGTSSQSGASSSTPPQARHVCSYCQKGFKHKRHFEDHVRIHTGERPFVCQRCGSGFKQHSQLQTHILGHSGEKPHKCPLCSAAYQQRQGLTIHLRRHANLKPYVCNICKRSYTQQGHLNSHSCRPMRAD
ncbi:RHS repeat-associated core domain-containing protein [Pseudomonas sp. MYb118]|uniref:RHS repeat-associated core domain-containing protein n=1 Tax=Pseudomonas sp. MYb118 TaxID=1848720 RepID=UPI0034CD0DD3